MGKNVIRMNEDDLINASQELKKSYVQADDIVSSAPNKFSQIKKTGLFSEGFSVINGQINSVSTSLNNISNILKKNSEKFFNLERTYAEKAEEIEIPIDFVKNDSRKLNTIDDIRLSKKDGKEIKTYKPSEISDNVEYTEKEEKLGKLKTDSETELSSYDDRTSIKSSTIKNIVKDETKEQEFKHNYNFDLTALNTIHNNNNTEQSEYDNTSVIEKVNISNINNGKTTTLNNFNDSNRISKTTKKKVNNDISLDDLDDVLLEEISR